MSAVGCIYTGEGHHSPDLLAVYHGRPEPVYICGYHEERFGVPSAGSKRDDDGEGAKR